MNAVSLSLTVIITEEKNLHLVPIDQLWLNVTIKYNVRQ